MHSPREAYGVKAGVASEEPLASAAAAEVLARGGNAVDAAVALSFALAVVVPHLGGLGGDYLALVKQGDRILFINGSGPAPGRLSLEELVSRGYDEPPSRGPLSITVPGLVDGLYLLWERMGSMEWRELVEPARQLASEGFPAPPSLVAAVDSFEGLLSVDEGSRNTYLRIKPQKPGDHVKYPGMARLLEIIQDDPRAFYEGEPADAIEDYLEEKGGLLSRVDMKRYSAEEGSPVKLDYRGWLMWEMPPNSQGITTLHIMGILEQWRLPRNPLDRLYYIISASRVAYESRDRELGDPRYMNLTPRELLSDDYIGMMRSIASEGPPSCLRQKTMPRTRGDTTFYTVADASGVLVAGIQSLFQPFGSGITEPRFQVTLHGRANGFTLVKGLPNTLEPGKRPLHTLSAVIAERGEEYFSIGVSGGHYRPQQHALMLTSIIDHGYSIGDAIALPRVLWTPGTCRLVADRGVYLQGILPGYEAVEGRTGVANSIHLKNNVVIVATDPRGDGYPLVF